MMKVAILGTRGIPNHYGGFEQFAEYLSVGLVERGHSVLVYNSHNHPYQEKIWNNVNISHQFDPEYKIGTIGQFIYDLNCILNLRRNQYDIVLQLGYTSSSIWAPFLPKKPLIVTNMDGLEWKRSKYGKITQKFLKAAEKWAVKSSDYLIADSLGIQEYLKNEYDEESVYLAYGAEKFESPDFSIVQAEFPFLSEYEYNMLIARMEPENHIEEILTGFYNNISKQLFIVVGNYDNKYGSFIYNKFKDDPRIIFIGGLYNLELLNNLRFFSNLYFHGHSVGGTNPSLLEAMASSACICAHKNVFNSTILGEDAFYFQDSMDVSNLIESRLKENESTKIFNNLAKIKKEFSWNLIIDKYEIFLKFACKSGKHIK